MPIKEILDEAICKANEALYKTLNDHGVTYDDNTGTIYVDDHENKKTYYISEFRIEECPEYSGNLT